jgi:hypothetical protein
MTVIVGDPALITITVNPQVIAGPIGPGSSVLIVNLDLLTTVYIGYSRGIGPGSSNTLAIPPLGSTTADASRPVWAVSNPAAQIQVLPGGSSWSASPAQIAEQIAITGINVNITGINVITPSGDTTGATDTGKINGQLASAGIGQVNLQPGGIYYINSPILMKSFTGLNGGNMRQMAIPTGNYGIGGLAFGGAIIKPVAGFLGSAAILMASPGAVQQGNVDIRCLSIDGSSLPAGTVHGIEANGAWGGITIRDMLIYKVTGNGLYGHNDGTSQPDFWHVSNSKFSACGGIGVSTSGLADSWFTDCEATGNTGNNWDITNGSNSRFTNCKGEFSTTGHGWNITGFTGFTGHVTFEHCNGENNGGDGFHFTGLGSGLYDFIQPFAKTNTGTDFFLNAATTNVPRGYPAYRQLTTFAVGYSVGGSVDYRLNAEGKLEFSIRNLIHDGITVNTDGSIICTAANGIVAGYRPNHDKRFPVYCDQLRQPTTFEAAAIVVGTDGALQCYGQANACTRVDGYVVLPLDTG